MHQSKVFAILLLGTSIGALCAGSRQATDLDTLLRGREYKMPALDASLRSGKDMGKMATQSSSAGKNSVEGSFMLQFDALADFDAAQKRREDLQRRTGYTIQMVFDAPFYKLRAGSFSKKADAQAEADALSASNIGACVVKVK